MKKAFIHDNFYISGGAEKVIESFTNIWPDFDFFSLIDFLNENDRRVILKGKSVTTSFIQKLPFAKTKFRNYLPLYPLAIESLDLSEYELILSSSSAVAKGVITRYDQIHISYVHSPMRYAWDLSFEYLRESGLDKGMKGSIAKYFLHKIRAWDANTAHRPDYYIANSKHIARRIKKIYNKESVVIYPPVDTALFTPSEKKDDYFITASRMVPYKKIDLIVEALAGTQHRLLVVGDGPEMTKIKSKSSANIEFLGYVPREQMKDLFGRAKAFIFAAEEDFGIVPIEAQACGLPVIAYGRGGTLETVIGDATFSGRVESHHTGIFFNQQTPRSLIDAVNLFEKNSDKFDSAIIRAHAEKFSRETFETSIKFHVDSMIQEWKNNLSK